MNQIFKTIPTFLMICICLFTGCTSPGRFFPEKSMQKIPYIIVYGRENCSACKTVKRKLNDAQVTYVYKDMNDEHVSDEVYSRMEKAGLNTKKFLIPVIDVNGSLAIRPSFHDLLYRYGHSSPEDHNSATDSSDPACGEVGSNPSNCSEQSR